jgi:hypothetical protein
MLIHPANLHLATAGLSPPKGRRWCTEQRRVIVRSTLRNPERPFTLVFAPSIRIRELQGLAARARILCNSSTSYGEVRIGDNPGAKLHTGGAAGVAGKLASPASTPAFPLLPPSTSFKPALCSSAESCWQDGCYISIFPTVLDPASQADWRDSVLPISHHP